MMNRAESRSFPDYNNPPMTGKRMAIRVDQVTTTELEAEPLVALRQEAGIRHLRRSPPPPR